VRNTVLAVSEGTVLAVSEYRCDGDKKISL